MDEEVPNARLKSGKTIISTCKLCLQPFFDPSPTRKACHLLGIPGSGTSKCEHRGDLPEEIKLVLKDSCEPVRRRYARGAIGLSRLFGCGSPNPNVPQVASNSSSPAPPKTSKKQSTMPKMLRNEETAYWDRFGWAIRMGVALALHRGSWLTLTSRSSASRFVQRPELSVSNVTKNFFPKPSVLLSPSLCGTYLSWFFLNNLAAAVSENQLRFSIFFAVSVVSMVSVSINSAAAGPESSCSAL